MTNEEKFAHWLKLAQYDLDTAGAMYDSGRWLYVTFTCQQAIEKLCKGLYTLYVDDNFPRIHNIVNIYMRFADKLPETTDEKYLSLFDRLTAYYIRGRYLDFEEDFSDLANKTGAETVLAQTKEAFSWLLTLKP